MDHICTYSTFLVTIDSLLRKMSNRRTPAWLSLFFNVLSLYDKNPANIQECMVSAGQDFYCKV